MTPRQIDEARRPPPEPWPRHAPRDRRPSSPRSSPPPRAYQIDPAREGYPDLIALPDEPYWVRTKLTSGPLLGRARPQPPRYAPARRNRRPRRRRPAAGPQPQGQPDRRHPDDPRPPGPADPGSHRGPTDRWLAKPARSPASIRSGTTSRSHPKALTGAPSNTPPKNRKSSNSAWPTWATRSKPAILPCFRTHRESSL